MWCFYHFLIVGGYENSHLKKIFSVVELMCNVDGFEYNVTHTMPKTNFRPKNFNFCLHLHDLPRPFALTSNFKKNVFQLFPPKKQHIFFSEKKKKIFFLKIANFVWVRVNQEMKAPYPIKCFLSQRLANEMLP